MNFITLTQIYCLSSVDYNVFDNDRSAIMSRIDYVERNEPRRSFLNIFQKNCQFPCLKLKLGQLRISSEHFTISVKTRLATHNHGCSTISVNTRLVIHKHGYSTISDITRLVIHKRGCSTISVKTRSVIHKRRTLHHFC